MSKLSDTTHRTTVFIPSDIKEKLPDRVNLSGLIRDLLSDYVNGKLEGGEWKEGFIELYTFFQDVMQQSNLISKDKVSIWNHILSKRDLKLIDKLAGEFK